MKVVSQKSVGQNDPLFTNHVTSTKGAASVSCKHDVLAQRARCLRSRRAYFRRQRIPVATWSSGGDPEATRSATARPPRPQRERKGKQTRSQAPPRTADPEHTLRKVDTPIKYTDTRREHCCWAAAVLLQRCCGAAAVLLALVLVLVLVLE